MLDRISKMLNPARSFIRQKVDYTFTKRENMVLDRFFTNTDRKVFFIHTLPSVIIATLLSMYSRIKNNRGLRGHFVDNILPLMLLNFSSKFSATPGSEKELKELVDKMQEYLKENSLNTLDKFCNYSLEYENLFQQFLVGMSVDKKYLKRIASSPKFRLFLQLFLDKFGHNSIARPSQFVIGLENVSILAAKSIEWSRPGSAFIELSTRYVKMNKSSLYPVYDEIGEEFGSGAANISKDSIMSAFDFYKMEMEDETSDDSFERFLLEKYRGLVPDDELKAAINGEKCDVMGNLLPAATLTSLGISVSGEEFPDLIKHLYLDATPENIALTEMIIEEAAEIGADNFIRHLDISEWQELGWRYLDERQFTLNGGVGIDSLVAPDREFVEYSIYSAFSQVKAGSVFVDFSDLIDELKKTNRSKFDKLPSQFEFVSAWAKGVMSFRGWRDLHRMGFSTHLRTLLTPVMGFYNYDKPAPKRFFSTCQELHWKNLYAYDEFQKLKVPGEVIQYCMALGNFVGFQIGANLRQHEFCNWQRTKFSVNHEVRQVFLSIEKKLRQQYTWWSEISRADMTEGYVFARTKNGIPLH